MPKTVVSPPVYSEDEYNIAALLSPQSVQKIGALQNRLEQMLGNGIWPTSPNCLHITLMEIICDSEYKGLSRAEHFRLWHEKYNRLTRDVIASFLPFDLKFNEVQVSQGAIIVKSPNPRPLNEIRTKLLSEIELPGGTKTPPDIAHCTIARYNKALDLDDVRLRTGELGIDFTEHVTHFSLVKDLVPPDFNPTIIEMYDLLGTTEHD